PPHKGEGGRRTPQSSRFHHLPPPCGEGSRVGDTRKCPRSSCFAKGNPMKYAAIRAAFELLWLSRLPALSRALSRSRGVIFTLHRILPEDPPAFSPNAILQIRPDFLDYVIERVRDL